ncbi:hypothetical protein D3C77_808860 [compost metagenome]
MQQIEQDRERDEKRRNEQALAGRRVIEDYAQRIQEEEDRKRREREDREQEQRGQELDR